MRLVRIAIAVLLGIVLVSTVACKAEYSLSVSVYSGQGVVTPTSGTYTEGTAVTIAAIPDSGWEFERWDGDISGDENPTTVRISRDKIIQAYFIQTQIPTPTATPTPTSISTPTLTPTPTSTPTIEPTPTTTPHNIVISPIPTPTSPISSVVLKILQNDTDALVFGFDFLDADGQTVSFSGVDNARFCGVIWQEHLDAPISYVVQIDTIIYTNLDTGTIPYSVLNFSGVNQSQPVHEGLRIYGLFTNTPNHINLENYGFQEDVEFTGELLQMPVTIDGKQ